MLIALVFFVLFLATCLLLLVLTAGRARELKQTRSRLEAFGLTPQARVAEPDEILVRRSTALSTIPWLDRLLSRADGGVRLRLLLRQADLNWPVGRLVLLSVLAAVVCGYLVFLRTQALLPSFCLAALAGACPFFYVIRLRNRRFARLRQLLPEALDLMVAALRAGHGFSSAIGMVARESPEPVRGEFRQCFDEQNFGLELRTAMNNLAYRAPIRDIRTIVTAVLIQKETGGNLTEILEKVAHIIREDFRLQRQVEVHTAQGRLTGWILSVLPLVLGTALYLVNPEAMSVLWTRSLGLKMIYGAVVMTIIGGLIIRRIVRVEI
jgi:tight adherence protein B